MAADSAPLLARIRRLVAAPPAGGSRADAWLPGALTLVALLAAGAAHFSGTAQAAPGPAGQAAVAPAAGQVAGTGAQADGQADTQVDAESDTQADVQADIQDTQADAAPGSVAGRWTAALDGRQVRLELTTYKDDGGVLWNSVLRVPAAEGAELLARPAVDWQLRREAGTFFFTGAAATGASGRRGAGALRFAADAAYAEELAQLGYAPPSPAKCSELAVHDVTPGFVREFQELGYEALPLDRLVEFRVHGVGPELVRDLARLGYERVEPARLVELRVHGVTPELIREVQALGYRDVPLDRLVEMRIHGETPAGLVRELSAGESGQ